MAINYIAADGTVTELTALEWQYIPTTPLTVNSSKIKIAATNSNIICTTEQKIFVVVGSALITSNNRDTAGYSTQADLDLVISEVISEGGSYYHASGVGSGAYKNCTNISTVEMPETISIIESGAFQGCSQLTEVTYPQNTTITNVADSTYKGCSSLTTLNNINITSIGSNAFEGCSSLSNIDLSSVTFMGEAALKGTGITALTFNETLAAIPNSCAQNCDALTQIIIPTSITSIGSNAFEGCDGLDSIYISKGDSLTIANTAFSFSQTMDIYVNWAEGEVVGAPWGATNATIHYLYVNYPAEDNYPSETNYPNNM